MRRLERIVVSILGTIGSFDLLLLLGAIVLLETREQSPVKSSTDHGKELKVINGNCAIFHAPCMIKINDDCVVFH